MSIIHTFIPKSDTRKISARDQSYLRRKLKDNTLLNKLLNKKVNRELLDELHCILDSKPLPRRKARQYMRASKVTVTNTDGVLLRIEHANGKVMKELR